MRISNPGFECEDCYEEAKMDVGILDGGNVPRNLKQKFRQAYENEFYYAHDDPNGFRSKIRPFQS